MNCTAFSNARVLAGVPPSNAQAAKAIAFRGTPVGHRMNAMTASPLVMSKSRLAAGRAQVLKVFAVKDGAQLDRPLRVAVIGGGPSGACTAETLSKGGVETFLIERKMDNCKVRLWLQQLFAPFLNVFTMRLGPNVCNALINFSFT
jgi:geranylgeranyl reductase